MKTLTLKAMTGLVIALALLLPTVALAQQQHQTFKDADGREVGRSVSDGRTTVFRDAMAARSDGRSPTAVRPRPTTTWVVARAASAAGDQLPILLTLTAHRRARRVLRVEPHLRRPAQTCSMLLLVP
jgi:hypothetical protein